MHHHPENFRSSVFRSLKKTLFAGCQDPTDHVDPAAVRRCPSRPPQSTAIVSVGCGHRAPHRHPTAAEDGAGSACCGSNSESQLSREADNLQRAVDLWARQQKQLLLPLTGVYPRRSVDVAAAEDLLRGAIELQESLALLREIHEASRSKKRRSARRDQVLLRSGPPSVPAPPPPPPAAAVPGTTASAGRTFDTRNYHRIYDNPWHSVPSSSSSSSSGTTTRKDLSNLHHRPIQQCRLPTPPALPSSSDDNTSFTQSLRFTSTTASVASCSNFKSRSDNSDDASVSGHNTKPLQNLIVKLMGLEDEPTRPVQPPVDNHLVVTSAAYLDDAKMPEPPGKTHRPPSNQRPPQPQNDTFQHMIDSLRIKPTPTKCPNNLVRRASMDDSIFLFQEPPPIVLIKPMLRSFDDQIMRRDFHVYHNNASSNKPLVQNTIPPLDHNNKTLVRMLQGKQIKHPKAAPPTSKVDLPAKNKLHPRTVLPAVTPNHKPNLINHRKLTNHDLPQLMTTPSTRKVEVIRTINKTLTPTADLRRPRSLVPAKIQKQTLSAETQQLLKTSTAPQNRYASLDPVVTGKQKRKIRAKPQTQLKPQTQINMVSPKKSSELEDKNPTPGDANPSLNIESSIANYFPEIKKQECAIPRKGVGEMNLNSTDEPVTIPIHDVVELPFLSQEEINIARDPNFTEKPEGSPCHEVELPTTSQEGSRTVNDRITVVSEADPDKEIKPLLLNSSTSVNNAEKTFDPDEAQSAYLRVTLQNADVRHSKVVLDCCIELLQCGNYHVKLSNLAMLRSHAQNTYSLYSQDQLDEEIRQRVQKFRCYMEPTVDTASLGGLYWRLQMDLNCNGLMGIGGWDCGWIDGISVDEVEQIVSNIEESIACKLIEEVTLELVSSRLTL